MDNIILPDMDIVIFGAGGTGKRYSEEILSQGKVRILCFLDNSKAKQGTQLNGIGVFSPEKIRELKYSQVVVATLAFESDIIQQLIDLGVDTAKITIHSPHSHGINSAAVRRQWLEDYAKIVHSQRIFGNVAEAGVFRGDFAKCINETFPNKTLYLFDTFEGFPERDVQREELPSNSKAGYYDATDTDLVLGKLPYPEKVVIKKGYFPQTAVGIDDTFCFVNLDLDLYQPTFEGLKFFYYKMSKGGVILIHDYFGIDFPNVKTAVLDFEYQFGITLKKTPIGDSLSVAICR